VKGWPFIWDARYRTPRATYPNGGAETRLPPKGLPFLFSLAPGGVYLAAAVAGSAVRSYRTLSPLPRLLTKSPPTGGLLSVALSLGLPPPGVTRHPCSVEPGLSSPAAVARQRRGGHPAIWHF